MATQIVPASQNVDHHRPTAPSAASHYAAMRRAEQAARSLSTQHSAHIVLGGLTGITWDEVTEVAAARDSYYLLAAAHRSAAKRMERGDRRRARIKRAARPVVRIIGLARRAVTA